MDRFNLLGGQSNLLVGTNGVPIKTYLGFNFQVYKGVVTCIPLGKSCMNVTEKSPVRRAREGGGVLSTKDQATGTCRQRG